MAKKIFKYAIDCSKKQEISMPRGAKLLTVQVQAGSVQVWALVDEIEVEYGDKALRAISVYGTGHNMPDNPGEYVGTFQLNGGALVFHVFDEGEI